MKYFKNGILVQVMPKYQILRAQNYLKICGVCFFKNKTFWFCKKKKKSFIENGKIKLLPN